ncbi:MAG: hypothetical protein QM750_20715 [Rubrivivax sp.]
MTAMKHLMTVPAALLLAGCVTFGPPPLAVGQTEAEVVAVMGAPTGRYAMPEGVTRLEYATGPFGRHTWMVDIGPDGRSRRFQQVLEWRNLAAFQQRAAGMSIDELLRELGRPGDRAHGGLRGGETWSYRYPTNNCLWFQVSIGADGKVTGAGDGIDPMCDTNDRARE